MYEHRILDPQFIEWLLQGDAATHYFGWQFFRSEAWSFPLGVINNYQYPEGTSIVYTDSIPLVAILLKPFSGLLSGSFQFKGFWLLSVYILQGYFSALVLSKITTHKTVICLGSLLLLMNGVLVHRAGGHEALSAHWLILAALNLYFLTFNRKTMIFWGLLIIVASLIHFYLLFMVLMIWLGYLIKEIISNNLQQLSTYCIAAVVTLFMLLVAMWVSGYFVIPATSTGSVGYGVYSMNLLAPFMNNIFFALPGQYEGMNYLGLGCILLVILSAYDFYRNTTITIQKKHYGLFFISIILLMLAVTNKVTFGKHVVFELPLPDIFLSALGIVRSSGRLFWPVTYIVLIAAISIITQANTKKQTAVLMIVIVCIQLFEFYPRYQNFRLTNKIYENPLKSAQWSRLASHYKHLAIVPASLFGDYYIPFALLASDHQMTLNVGYTARSDNKLRIKYAAELNHTINTGKYLENTLYVIKDPKLYNHHKSPPQFQTLQLDGVLIAGYDLQNIASSP